ncbi:MAG: SGNH/GDSL hydrolase family protein [Nitrospinae bacterium]|nr:SGNH/GDSL hydrolase family protein [Nitrospinota bacterium]
MARMFRHRTIGLIATAGIGFLSLLGTVAAQGQDCPVPPSLYNSEPTLPKTAAALASGHTVSIVAIGGASTVGIAAGSPELAWPARLATALTSRFPAAFVAVDNRAVARQTAQEMASRLDREVIGLRPTLVIWETGTADAVHGTEIDAFRQTIQAGIDRLRASGAEVMLMDMQFSRRTHTVVINFDRYQSVLREVTDANEVPLFRRYDIMHHWAESRVFDLMTGDQEKLRRIASRLYDCIGRAVADFLTRGIHPAADANPASSGSQK